MQFTRLFHKLIKCKKRYVILQGGTSSSKTWSTLQLLYLRAMKYPNLHISIVAESLPVLKRGAMKDFFKMLKDEGVYDESKHNKTNNTYQVGESIIEFFSVDDSSKARGSRRAHLYVNESNNINYDTFTELEVRTSSQIIIDFNPVSSFWAHEKLMTKPDDTFDFIKSTYLDNDLLDPQIVKSIESKKDNTEWFKVYGLGEVGSTEGLVFNNWQLVDEMPEDYKWEKFGIDWGFTNDPSTCIRVCLSEGMLWVDELMYQSGMTNADISNFLSEFKDREFVADSAEPKSLEDLRRYGYSIRPSVKGPDSVRRGIDAVKKYKLCVTKRSTNLIKELRNYQWRKLQNGDWDSKPIDSFNHCIDPLRYVVADRDNAPSGDFDIDIIDFV